MTNYFATHTAAERYARARPYFHPLIIEKIKAFLHLAEPVPLALDIACGTGLSTRALCAIARRVLATDISSEMIAHAPRDPHIAYCLAAADAQPLRERSIELIPLSTAFHWLGGARFLAAVQRVLQPDGWLIIYDNAFAGQVMENPAFGAQARAVFLTRYPSPLGSVRLFSASDAAPTGFEVRGHEPYQNVVRFSRDELADYFSTHSNVITVVEGESERIVGLREATAGLPKTPISDESVGTAMLYSSGTTGRPKGVRQTLSEAPPEVPPVVPPVVPEVPPAPAPAGCWLMMVVLCVAPFPVVFQGCQTKRAIAAITTMATIAKIPVLLLPSTTTGRSCIRLLL